MIDVASGWRGHLDILGVFLTTTPAPGFWSVFTKLIGDYATRFK